MRDIIFLEKPVIPMRNKVLVKIKDTYDEKTSTGGIIMHNAAHFEAEADSTGFNLSQWIIRSGVVHTMPRHLTMSDYDWKPLEGEISVGDTVYWNIVRFFDYPVIRTNDGSLFLLVDYHEIHLKKVDDKPVPVNGFYLFTRIMVEKAIFEYVREEHSGKFKLEAMSEEVEWEYGPFNAEAEWVIGDECLLNVPPYKLESDISQEFDKEYYMAQKRHILMSG